MALAARPMSFAVPEGGPLEFRGAVALRPSDDAFGGLSGLALTGPRAALAVSDAGRWARFRLRIEAGRLVGAEDAALAPMLDRAGDRPPRGARDAEALARDPGTGRLWVAFEGYHRLQAWDDPLAAPVAARRNEAWERGFGENGGFEALALDRGGRLWAIRETAVGGAHEVWIDEPAGWRVARLPAAPPFRPTGAEFGPDGRLYLAERAFSFTAGFRFRLRRFAVEDGAPTRPETLLELGAETFIDNVEAIAIWEEEGRTFLLLLSDDNFLPLQRTILALFEATG